MAAPNYLTDLVMISNSETITGWSALGGGASGLAAETDYFIQGSFCVSKQVTGAATIKGQIYNTGSAITPGADDHFFQWLYSTTPGLIDTLALGGMRVTIGTSLTAYVDFHVQGAAEYVYGGWKCFPIRYNNTTSAVPPYRTLTSTPGANPQYFGGQLRTTGTAKTANFGVDVCYKGTGFYITAGDSTTPATFSGSAAINDSQSNRYGVMQRQDGAYLFQGRFVVGQNASAVATQAYFKDSNATVTILDTPHSLTDFTQIRVDHSSSYFELNDSSFNSIGTNNRGRLVFLNSLTTGSINGCSFSNFGTTVLNSNVTADGCTWRGSDSVTQSGSLISDCVFDKIIASSSLISNNVSRVTNCSFVSDGSNHAIQCIVTGTFDMTGMSFTGYATTSGSTGNESFYNNSGGLVTLNIISGDVPTVRDGTSASTVLVTNTYQIALTGLIAGTEVRIYNSTTGAELAGIESSTTSFSYSYTYSVDIPIYIVIFNVEYRDIRLVNLTLSSQNQSIPVQQQVDRVYLNP